MLKELEWEDSQKSRAEEHATNHDTIKLRSDDNDRRKRGVSCGDGFLPRSMIFLTQATRARWFIGF